MTLQWGHGEFAVDDPAAPRRCRRPRPDLQWGHGEFAVDDHVLELSLVIVALPSMGPRRIRRG